MIEKPKTKDVSVCEIVISCFRVSATKAFFSLAQVPNVGGQLNDLPNGLQPLFALATSVTPSLIGETTSALEDKQQVLNNEVIFIHTCLSWSE